MKYWILKRYNPQLGVYYCGLGKMSKKDAKSRENTLYGDNYVTPYDTVEEYSKELKRLDEAGEVVR